MSTQPPLTEPLPSSQPIVSEEKKAPAPVWHTVLMLALILGNSLAGSFRVSKVAAGQSRILLYSGTLIVELLLFALVWLGIRKRITMRELIGGRWKTFEDFLLDIAVAAVFFVSAAVILAGVRLALGVLNLHDIHQQTNEIKHTIGALIPQTGWDLTVFLVLSVAAGLFEEIVFRGYLQQQIGALARNAWIGIAASAAVFGLAHGYQGWRMMIVIGIYGGLFGILAYMRKSLRPGMMAHAFQDGASGILLFLFSKHGML